MQQPIDEPNVRSAVLGDRRNGVDRLSLTGMTRLRIVEDVP